eukprot:TRINITY_DN21836_c0_g1_i1.p1 TRINITY_DN21836_c0_g1~~TRINITY_DN21836_c0_g1_i1.p1  ORF type:complete len:382 (+),score=33.57 TRINITY_DN21836_c0_g1_i1:69-1214(+)
MGKFKTRHLMMARDRGQGYDKKFFPGNPNSLTAEELKHELEIRGLPTWGTTRKMRSRFMKALCQGIKPGDHKKTVKKTIVRDDSGTVVYFDMPDIPGITEDLVLKQEGRQIEYTDLSDPQWITLFGAFPLPDDTVVEWTFEFTKVYNCVIGVARKPFVARSCVGADENSWGYCVNLGSKLYHDNTGAGESYGKACKAGDKVTVTMDTTTGTIKFSRNGEDFGEAFHDIYGSIYPAISICGHSHIVCTRSGVANDKEIADITLRDCVVPDNGTPSAKRKFRLNTPAVGGPLTITPVSLDLHFSPEMVTVQDGATTSNTFTMTMKEDAEAGECTIVASVCEGKGNLNVVDSPYAVEGVSIGKKATATTTTQADAQPAKKQRVE